MMDYEKTPLIRKRTLLCKIVFIIISLVLCMLALTHAVNRGDRYLEIGDHALSLQGTIVSIDEDWDSDNSSEYTTIIGYTYQGKYYEIDHKTYGTYKGAAKHLGESVTLHVDPEHPEDTLSSISSRCAVFSVLGMILVIAALGLLTGKYRMRYVDTYGWNRHTVQMDLPVILWHSHNFIALLMASAIGYFLLYRYREFASVFFWIANTLLLFFGLYSLRSYRRKMRHVKQERFTMRRETLIHKEYTPDSDGDSYVLTFQNEENTWKQPTNKKVFQSLSEGSIIESVYIEGDKKPRMTFSRECDI